MRKYDNTLLHRLVPLARAAWAAAAMGLSACSHSYMLGAPCYFAPSAGQAPDVIEVRLEGRPALALIHDDFTLIVEANQTTANKVAIDYYLCNSGPTPIELASDLSEFRGFNLQGQALRFSISLPDFAFLRAGPGLFKGGLGVQYASLNYARENLDLLHGDLQRIAGCKWSGSVISNQQIKGAEIVPPGKRGYKTTIIADGAEEFLYGFTVEVLVGGKYHKFNFGKRVMYGYP